MGTTIGNSIKQQKQKLVQKLFDKSIRIMNKEINLKDYQDEYTHNENRSLLVRIKNLGDFGFVIENGQVRTICEGDTITTTAEMSMDEFILVATGEEEIATGWLQGSITFQGKNVFRDLEIFSRVSQKNKFLFRRMKE